LVVAGVLKPGVTVAQAHEEVHALAMQLAAEHPDTNRGWDARVVDTSTGRTAPQTYYNLALTSVASGLVLLIGWVNVALLLLSRTVARLKEFSVRLAVGASAFRIVRQQAFEGLLIAIPATVIGLALAVSGVKLLRMSADRYYDRILIDWQLLRVAAYTSLVAPIIFGFVPAVQLLRNRMPLTTGGWTEAQSGRTGRRTQRILATSQLGAALILVIVSAIVLQSVLTSILMNTGFDTTRVMTTNLALPTWKYADSHRFAQTFTTFIDRVCGLPGVTSAAGSSVVPSITTGPAVPVKLESETPAADGPEAAELNVITPRLFETIGIDVVSGREFTVQDTADTPLVALVNRQFALRYVANPHDLVRRRLSVRGESRLREIVGVVGNTRNAIAGDIPAVVYLPGTQEPQRTMFLVARVPDGSSPEPVRRTLAEVDPDVAPYQLRTVREAIRQLQSEDLAMFGPGRPRRGLSGACGSGAVRRVFLPRRRAATRLRDKACARGVTSRRQPAHFQGGARHDGSGCGCWRTRRRVVVSIRRWRRLRVDGRSVRSHRLWRQRSAADRDCDRGVDRAGATRSSRRGRRSSANVMK
jgi:predicted permease